MQLDRLGDHAVSCHFAGRLKTRSRPVKKTWARVLRESGARVRENVMLRDTTLPTIDPSDGRNIEIVVTGLPLGRGIPVAVDATVVSPLGAGGLPHPGADLRAGVALAAVRKTKQRTYRKLVGSPVVTLCTAASETGGRLNTEALALLDAAASLQTRSEPPVLQRAAMRAWRARWLTMVSVSVQTAVAATLVDEGTAVLDAAAGPAPLSTEVWLNARQDAL